jgi:hypothetical protein
LDNVRWKICTYYIRNHITRLGFFDKLFFSSDIELELGPSRIKGWILTPFWIMFFLGQMRCQSACYNKSKMGLYVEFSWEMAVWEPKEKNSGWWRHLHLIRHFEVLKNKFCYDIFFIELSIFKSKVSIDLQSNWLSYEKFMLSDHLDFLRHFVFFYSNLFFLFFLMILTFKIYH